MNALDNLVRTNLLRLEPPDRDEFDGMLAAATTKLQDVKVPGLSADSQSALAYGAAGNGILFSKRKSPIT